MADFRPTRDEELIRKDLPADFRLVSGQATRNVEQAVNNLIDEFEADLDARLDKFNAVVKITAEISTHINGQLAAARTDLNEHMNVVKGRADAVLKLADLDETARQVLEGHVKDLSAATGKLVTRLNKNEDLAKSLAGQILNRGLGIESETAEGDSANEEVPKDGSATPQNGSSSNDGNDGNGGSGGIGDNQPPQAAAPNPEIPQTETASPTVEQIPSTERPDRVDLLKRIFVLARGLQETAGETDEFRRGLTIPMGETDTGAESVVSSATHGDTHIVLHVDDGENHIGTYDLSQSNLGLTVTFSDTEGEGT